MIGPVQFAELQNHALKKYRIRNKLYPPITMKILVLRLDDGLPAKRDSVEPSTESSILLQESFYIFDIYHI